MRALCKVSPNGLTFDRKLFINCTITGFNISHKLKKCISFTLKCTIKLHNFTNYIKSIPRNDPPNFQIDLHHPIVAQCVYIFADFKDTIIQYWFF